jgi:alpha-glucosidase (family GH31 glycosyl hydrolase)
MNYIGEKAADPLTFEIYPDENGNAETTLYEDDGVSPAYINGVFRQTTIKVSKMSVDIRVSVGNYNPGPRKFVFVIKGSKNKTVATNTGKSQKLKLQ